MRIRDFVVGQPAYLLESRYGWAEGTDRIKRVVVLKVGRVYVTVDRDGRRFASSEGQNPFLCEAVHIVEPAKLFLTYEDAVDEIEREALVKKREALVKKINNASRSRIYGCTLAQLEQIERMLFPDEPGK